MKKYLKAVVLFSVLIIAPLGSWYFLDSGLEWRKMKRGELAAKTKIIEHLSAAGQDVAAIFNQRTTVLKISGDPVPKDEVIIDQYKDGHTFQWMDLTSIRGLAVLENSTYANHDYLLIDTGMQVRRAYKQTENLMYSQLVEDIALILPKKKPIDIKMKSERK